MGGPDAVADAIARDAAASTAPFTRWVSVHVWSSHELTDGSKVMGVGAAFIMPSTLSILVQVFAEPRERAKAPRPQGERGCGHCCARCKWE